jgi:hypothetical protein
MMPDQEAKQSMSLQINRDWLETPETFRNISKDYSVHKLVLAVKHFVRNMHRRWFS